MESSSTLPTCIGFIMDGNRRYARASGCSLLEGHTKGYEVFAQAARWVAEAGIPHAVFYAFSTENWRREAEEVEHLMQLFRAVAHNLEAELERTGTRARIRFVGRRTDFTPDIQELLTAIEERSAGYHETTIWVALSYGGRAEIVSAAQALVAAGETVTEEGLARHLWTAGMPDPDLVVRTSGEQRLSNFLPWQAVYSELFFTPTLWPAFTKEEFTRILSEYAARQRRRGT